MKVLIITSIMLISGIALASDIETIPKKGRQLANETMEQNRFSEEAWMEEEPEEEKKFQKKKRSLAGDKPETKPLRYWKYDEN